MSRLYSFVLPAYKAEFIREAIDSILAQTYTNFELIIVNDASPEDLTSIVHSYNDTRIQYYVNEYNIGGKDLVAQWNHCISYAKGDYLILASDDDVYNQDYLLEMDRLVGKYPEVDVFRPRVKYIDENGKIIGVEGYLKEFCSALEFLQAWTNNWICSGIPYYVFNRRKLRSIGGFVQYPLAWFADDATVLRIAENGLVSSTALLFSFRWSGMSISSKRNNRKYLESKLIATNQFYEEVIAHITASSETSNLVEYLKNSLLVSFPKFLVNNKVFGQLSNACWVDVTCMLPLIMRFKFTNNLQIVRWYIAFTCKRILRIK